MLFYRIMKVLIEFGAGGPREVLRDRRDAEALFYYRHRPTNGNPLPGVAPSDCRIDNRSKSRNRSRSRSRSRSRNRNRNRSKSKSRSKTGIRNRIRNGGLHL